MSNIENDIKKDEEYIVLNNEGQEGVTSTDDDYEKFKEIKNYYGDEEEINLAGEMKKCISDLKKSIKELNENNQTNGGRINQLTIELGEKIDNLFKKEKETPANDEDENILKLVEYSNQITKQLGGAARNYISKKEELEKIEEQLENERIMAERKMDEKYEKGKKEGIKLIIMDILNKYADIDKLMDPNNKNLHMVWNALEENGVKIDGNEEEKYEKGSTINITEENLEKMSSKYSLINGPGEYIVEKTGLVLNEEVIYRAAFKKIENEDIIN